MVPQPASDTESSSPKTLEDTPELPDLADIPELGAAQDDDEVADAQKTKPLQMKAEAPSPLGDFLNPFRRLQVNPAQLSPRGGTLIVNPQDQNTPRGDIMSPSRRLQNNPAFFSPRESTSRRKKNTGTPGERFQDDSFPPFMRKPVNAWCRPADITHHEGNLFDAAYEWELFRGKPRATDVAQGVLGDCWFLSALATLAEFEDGSHVMGMFPDQDALDPRGEYCVRLCIGGWWRDIVVDDRFPCIVNKKAEGKSVTSMAYCSTHRRTLWASLVEKAMAKACGSYFVLDGGSASEALSCLTGWPCKILPCGKNQRDALGADELWAAMYAARSEGFLTTVSTEEASRDGEKVEKVGLSSSHCYSLLDVREVQTADGEYKRLLRIRDPQRWQKWAGDWSDQSDCWTPDLRLLMEYPEGGVPGVFVVNLEDFMEHFVRCTVCEIRSSSWRQMRVPVPQNGLGGPSLAALEVRFAGKGEVQCCLSVRQLEERMRIHAGLTGPLECIGFVVIPLKGPNDVLNPTEATAIVSSKIRCCACVSSETLLQGGVTYLLVPLALRWKKEPFQVVGICGGDRQVEVKARKVSADMMLAAWAAYARGGPKTEKAIQHGVHVYWRNNAPGGAVVVLAENHGEKNAQLTATFEGTGQRYSRGMPVTKDLLQPGEAQLVQVALPDNPTGRRMNWKGAMSVQIAKEDEEGPQHEPGPGSFCKGLHKPWDTTAPRPSDRATSNAGLAEWAEKAGSWLNFRAICTCHHPAEGSIEIVDADPVLSPRNNAGKMSP